MGRIRTFLELIRFSHTIFALPFAILSAGMAWFMNAHPTSGGTVLPFRWLDCVGILLCMVFARSAAMAFNRVADRKIDALNPRTATRHLPAGKVSTKSAVAFTVCCALGFIASTLCFLPENPIPLLMSVPVLLFLMGYSLAKRFTHWVHFWLGTALMLAPIAAWAAIRGAIWVQNVELWQNGQSLTLGWEEFTPFLLALGVMFWSAGFDMIYACMDAEFDKNHHVFSVPGRFGVPTALRIAAGCHAFVILPLFAMLWFFPPFRVLWAIGVGAIAILLIYEHSVVDVNDPKRVNVAFFNVNAVISVTLLLVGALEMILRW